MKWLNGISDDELILLNSFDLFGLSGHLDLDEDLLETRYIQMTQRAHPDRNAENQEWAMVLTARINQAFEELNFFRTRAEAFLKIKENQTVSNHKSMPAGFLQKVFLWNEEKEEGTLDLVEVEECYEEIESYLIDESLKPEFDKDEFRMKLNGLKYMENLMCEGDFQ